MTIQVSIFQATPKIGDLEYNFNLIKECYDDAVRSNSDICLLPELIATGYFPEDLLLRPAFIDAIQAMLGELLSYCTNKKTALLVSLPLVADNKLYSAVVAIQDCKIIGKTYKVHLPNYGVFDEMRYFAPGDCDIIVINGYKIGIPICEDIWHEDVIIDLYNMGAEMFLVPNGSPFDLSKMRKRIDVVSKAYKMAPVPIIYCNQALANDSIIYDGRSFVWHHNKHVLELKPFAEDSGIVRYDSSTNQISHNVDTNRYDDLDILYSALVYATRSYVLNCGFKSVIIGLSGGIDSALVAAIAADAVGASNVYAVMMPSYFTSAESLVDAEEIAKLLGINYEVLPINAILDSAVLLLKNPTGLAHQNLQARIRGNILMTKSNSQNSVVLTTGNKSEMAAGYATLYGDMCGAFNPIKDIYKTQVMALSAYRNKNKVSCIETFGNAHRIMPENVIEKAPTAELCANQKDSDSLPEYEVLDQILYLYIECQHSLEEIVAKGFDALIVDKVINLIHRSEYKRKQAVLGANVSNLPFDKARRYPIVYSYKY